MELVVGQIVFSRAGRDTNQFYMVTGFEKDRVLLADGGKWTLLAPKKKNTRHLTPTKTVLPVGQVESDSKLKASLAVFAQSQGTQQQGG